MYLRFFIILVYGEDEGANDENHNPRTTRKSSIFSPHIPFADLFIFYIYTYRYIFVRVAGWVMVTAQGGSEKKFTRGVRVRMIVGNKFKSGVKSMYRELINDGIIWIKMV